MAGALYIDERVITGDTLRRRHRDELEVCFAPQAVVTPTAWDYVRQHRLQVRSQSTSPPAESASPPPAEALVREVRPEQWIGEGRCEEPGRSCGCKDEEFGSGFAEPNSCRDCAIQRLRQEGRSSSGCKGCNRHAVVQTLLEEGGAPDLESLVRQIAEQVAARLRAEVS